jgi:hypothetical protein
MNLLRRTLIASLLSLALACTAHRPALRPAPPRDRLTDSPAEKLAALPVPDPAADAENQDRRFGIESARERGETAQRKREEKRRCVDVVSAQQAKGNKPPPCPPQKK